MYCKSKSHVLSLNMQGLAKNKLFSLQLFMQNLDFSWSYHGTQTVDLVAEMRSNTDLVCDGDEQVQSASTDAMILSHLQWGVTWSTLRFLFNCSRRSDTGDVEGSSGAVRVLDDLRLLGLLFLLVEGSCRADRTCS